MLSAICHIWLYIDMAYMENAWEKMDFFSFDWTYVHIRAKLTFVSFGFLYYFIILGTFS